MYYLKAAPSDILYHVTLTKNAINIIANNYFALVPSEGGGRDLEVGKEGYYYLSTARSVTSPYLLEASSGNSLFVLDGRKLGQRYKADAVHYWAKSNPRYNELEDRIYSKTSKIPARPYILSVRSPFTTDQQVMYNIYKVCKLAKIPLQFFKKYSDLLRGRNPIDWRPERVYSLPRQGRNVSRGSSIHGWLNLYRINLDGRTVKQALASKYMDTPLQRAYADLPINDSFARLHGAIMDARDVPHGHPSKAREALDALVAIMRKNGWDTKQYKAAMYNKWYKSRDAK